MLTVTILASDPRHPPDTDPVIEMVRAKLDTRVQATHEVFDASSVEELAGILRTVTDDPKHRPDLVQIVGHGLPGMLSLGYHWTGKYNDGPRGPHYVLDSDPNVYGVLDKPMKPDAEVLLLGCAVGEGDEGPQPLMANGAALIFDLAQMWNCRVSAPAEWISAADFESDGTFSNDAKATFNSVKGVEFSRAHAQRPPVQGSIKPEMSFENLRWAIQGKTIPVPAKMSDELNRMFDQRIERPEILATPEVIFDVTCDGAPATAEMLANGRILRVRRNGEVQYVAVKPTDLSAVRQLVREVMEPNYKPSINSIHLVRKRRAR
jgi:hypothetical protein